ncbi:MAG: discoidin domain-containing protein [Verrucomicrobiales bacterium]
MKTLKSIRSIYAFAAAVSLSLCVFYGLSGSAQGEVIFSQDFENGLGPNESVGGYFRVNDSNGPLNNGTKMMGHAEAYGVLGDESPTPQPAYSYYDLVLDLRNFTDVSLRFDFAGGMETNADGFNLVAGSGKVVKPPEGLLEPTNESEMQYGAIDFSIYKNDTTSRNIGAVAWSSSIRASIVDKVAAEFDLGDVDEQKVTIRFQFGADWYLGGDGANFDNIVVEGTALPDTDGDGMSDNYEDANGLDKNTDDRAGDLDQDTLTNIQEFELCTDPQNPDTDGDGVTDNVETSTGQWVSATDTGTDPLLKDSDGDALEDGVEKNTGVFVDASDTGTDPNNSDTDGDGANDALELNNGSNPTDANSRAVATIEILGTGTAALLGGDLTDPENDGDKAAGEDDPSWNWVSIDANHKPGFQYEGSAYNVFDNDVSANAKWCCSPPTVDAPLQLTVEFAAPISLTHFTITSAGDVPARDPIHWQIQGSNDGEIFAPIFVREEARAIWTARNQVVKVTLPNPSLPYKFIRYETTLNASPSEWFFHQLGELEYFGIPAAIPTHTLTIAPSEGGTVTRSPDLETYPAGTEVTLTATPNEGYRLVGWQGDTNEESNPSSIVITLNGDKEIHAVFQKRVDPKIKDIQIDPLSREVTLSWASAVGAEYEIEISHNLVDWLPLQSMTVQGGDTTTVTSLPDEPTLEANGQRFYRLREKQ